MCFISGRIRRSQAASLGQLGKPVELTIANLIMVLQDILFHWIFCEISFDPTEIFKKNLLNNMAYSWLVVLIPYFRPT